MVFQAFYKINAHKHLYIYKVYYLFIIQESTPTTAGLVHLNTEEREKVKKEKDQGRGWNPQLHPRQLMCW